MEKLMEKKIFVKSTFENIAPNYDLLNRLLSFGIDIYWRKKAIKLTNFKDGNIVLDVACGTGDFSLTALKKYKLNIFGADLSLNMLRLFNQKESYIKGKLVQTQSENLPFIDNIFDNIIVAFGIRNFYNIPQALEEFYRILKKNGKITILEFSLPRNKIFGTLYKFYFKKILPFVGGLISGNFQAYKYLPNSVEDFDEKVDLMQLFKEANFTSIDKYYFTFGVVQCIIVKK